MHSDTIFALATGRPPAAIAIVRVSGAHAHEAGQLIAGGLPEVRAAALRELRHPVSGEVLDQALVLRFDGPASATGEDVVEFHCHGSRAVVDALLGALEGVDGLRLAQPGEFTRRAFENGRIDLTEAEGLADLLEAETESQRRAALAVAEGGLRKQIELWQAVLIGLSARAELMIDYDGEADDGDPALSSDCGALATELSGWLERPRVEPLRDGVRVVIAGPPNSGKSSLLNAIAGSEKAIVTDIAGTTRDRIEVPLAIAGVPVVLTDTAGIRETEDMVEQAGVERAAQSMEQADVLLWLGEPEDAPVHPRRLLIHSRADLPERGRAPPDALAHSSSTGEGMTSLLEWLSAAVGALVPARDELALNRRQAILIEEARDSLRHARDQVELVLLAEDLRSARGAFDRLAGRTGVEDVLDALFGRFCLGK